MLSFSFLFRTAIETRFGSFLGGGGAFLGGGGGRALGFFALAILGACGTKFLLLTAVFLAGGG